MSARLRLAAAVMLSILSLGTPPAVAEDKRTPPPDLSGLAGPEAEAFYLGTNAIIWGYPAVLFEQLMRGRTSPDIVAKGNPQAAVNQFGLVRDLRGPEFKQIATPNNDTIYAQSFVDVSREPMVLSVPAVAPPRYYTFQLWDPNGDTFGYIGSRTTGREAGHFAFVGPDWQGSLPDGVTRIDTPYNGMVIWGRIGVDGPEDLQNALDIQDALRLGPEEHPWRDLRRHAGPRNLRDLGPPHQAAVLRRYRPCRHRRPGPHGARRLCQRRADGRLA